MNCWLKMLEKPKPIPVTMPKGNVFLANGIEIVFAGDKLKVRASYDLYMLDPVTGERYCREEWTPYYDDPQVVAIFREAFDS